MNVLFTVYSPLVIVLCLAGRPATAGGLDERSLDPSCVSLLVSKIEIPDSIPRVPVSEVYENPYGFLEQDSRLHLSPQRPAIVITRNSEPFLLAIDARQANRIGFQRFAREALRLGENQPSRAWVERVNDRFINYMGERYSPENVVTGLTKLFNKGTDLLQFIDELLFLRFFEPILEINSAQRSQFFVGPDKADRIALISLKVPRPTTPRAPDPIPVRTGLQRKMTSRSVFTDRIQFPQDLWLQRVDDFGIALFFWNVSEDSSRTRRSPALADLTLEMARRYSSPGIQPGETFWYIHRRTKGVLEVIKAVRNSDFQQFRSYSIQSINEVSKSEAAQILSDQVRNQTDKITAMNLSVSLGDRNEELQVYVPEAVMQSLYVSKLERTLQQNDLVAQALSLFSAPPSRKEDPARNINIAKKLSELPLGQDVLIELNSGTQKPKKENLLYSSVNYLFVFHRSHDGRLYLNGLLYF